MTRSGLRILSVGAVALGALLAADAVNAGNVQPAVVHYTGLQQRDVIRVAGLFGESDEEKAARLQHEADQDGQIAALNNKVRDLEDTVRTLTGQNEELQHRLGDLSARMDRQQKDFEYRLCAMAAQQLGASTGAGDSNAVPCPGSGGPAASYGPPPPRAQQEASNDDTLNDGGGTGGVVLGKPPGVLGTLPVGTANAGPRPMAGTDDGHAQFSSAMNLLAKARYDEASAAFRAFADAHPRDELAPQAVYWVADIAYVQKDYAGASRGFAEVIKKYPDSARAPDSMLKLGQSLIAGGQKQEGCTALAALPAKYPKASKAVLDQGVDARKANCRKVSS